MRHYEMTPSRNNPGVAHENGEPGPAGAKAGFAGLRASAQARARMAI